MVSGTHIHFGGRGGHSPSDQQYGQREPQTAVSSFLGLIRVACPLYCLGRISFYTFRPPQDNTCGFKKASTTDKDYNLINCRGGLPLWVKVDCLAMAWQGTSSWFEIPVATDHMPQGVCG